MTDYRNIRDACEAVVKAREDGHSLLSGERARARDEFLRTVHADTVLELLDEIERLAADPSDDERAALEWARVEIGGLYEDQRPSWRKHADRALSVLDRLLERKP